jgi:hypothetical protein
MIDKIKDLRKKIDNTLYNLRCLNPSREISLSITKIQEARMWTGLFLGLIGEPTPYANNGMRKNVKDIEKATDLSRKFCFVKGTQVEGVDKLREVIKEHINEYEDIKRNIHFTKQAYLQQINHTYQKTMDYLVESRLWLGMELGRIRDESK